MGKRMDLYSLNARNRLMILICWALTVTGAIAAYPSLGGETALIILAGGMALYALPAILVWKRRGDRYIMYMLVLIMATASYLQGPYIKAYLFSFIYPVILSLYFNPRPVLLMGLANLIYTVYFVARFSEPVFGDNNFTDHLIPLLCAHILLTVTLVAQSRIGDKLTKNSIILEHLSKVDALTGLYNHKEFHQYLEQMIARIKRGEKLQLQLAILDIDNFKQINDTYGHDTGDIILQRVAETIKQYTCYDDFVARCGGEEFAIVFTGTTMQEAYQRVERIRNALMELSHPEINQPVTISVGLKELEDDPLGEKELFRQADSLLYMAKRSGKNRTAM